MLAGSYEQFRDEQSERVAGQLVPLAAHAGGYHVEDLKLVEGRVVGAWLLPGPRALVPGASSASIWGGAADASPVPPNGFRKKNLTNSD